MTAWISERPAREVAADLALSRGPLAGVRLAVGGDVDVAGMPTTTARGRQRVTADRDAATAAALRAAGAVVVGKTRGGGCAEAVACGVADIALGRDVTGHGGVAITPTAGTISGDGVAGDGEPDHLLTVFASELALANRAMGVLTPTALRPWPSDSRLAAGPEPVLAIPHDWSVADGPPTDFETALAALADAGARIVEVDVTPFRAAAQLLAGCAPAAARYAVVADVIDAPPDAAVDPGLAEEIASASDIPACELLQARREINRLRAQAMASLTGADALVVPAMTALPDPFGLCAVTVGGVRVLARAYEDAVAFDLGAIASGISAPIDAWPVAAADVAELVVFGAHLRGGPLAHQLSDLGARWAGELTTAPHYRMTVLPTAPAKPAVTRVPNGTPGTGLTGHRWLLSPAALGRFLTALPAPMQLGKVEFADGTWRTAFGCDAASATGVDISGYGSWSAALAAGAV